MAHETSARVIQAQPRDLGGFSVRRVLPHATQRAVGPFVFLDRIGPADFPPDEGVDVRPHPHIGLATVTWLFEGELTHHDSTGARVSIRPGAVNLMTAGRGVTHSERTGPEPRASGHRLSGVQAWLALPKSHEDMQPRFEHAPADALPTVTRAGAEITVILGQAYGARSPASFPHPCAYLHVRLAGGAELSLPDSYAERAVFTIEGAVLLDDTLAPEGALGVVGGGAPGAVSAGPEGAEILVLAGDPLDGRRTMWWNFVHSDPARIEAAKRGWLASASAGWTGTPFTLPDGESEFVPLPE